MKQIILQLVAFVDMKMRGDEFSAASVVVRMADLCQVYFLDGEEPVLDAEAESEKESEGESGKDEL